MTWKQDVRAHFKVLEHRIVELLSELAPNDQTQPTHTHTPATSQQIEPAANDTAITITIPGITGSQHQRQQNRPLIALIDDDSEPVDITKPSQQEPTETATEKDSAALDELAACIEAPAVLLKLVEPHTSTSEKYKWAQWWLSTANSSSLDTEGLQKQQRDEVVLAIGPWLSRCVLPKASPSLLAKLPLFTAQALVFPYVDAVKCPETCWQTLLALLGMLSNKSTTSRLSQHSLTLVIAMLDHATSAKALHPSTSLRRIIPDATISSASLPVQRSLWTEYLQLMASVPGRVANAVEPQSIPIRLTQRQYFAAMARDTAELMASAAAAVTDKVSSMLRVRLVADLCAKMCRVGQTECLAVEIAARMLADVRDHGNKLLTAVLGNHDVDYEYGLLAGACKVLTRVAPPFGSRLVPAIVQQLDTVVCRVTAANEADGQVHGRLITEQVAVITASILFNYLDMDHSQPALDSAISSVARSPLGTYWSLPTYQAVALALQLLSGKATLQTDISLPFTRVFPDLLESALTGCLLPMWSQPDLVTYGQPEQCKALTVLVLSSIGAMDSKERMRVSQSTAFMRAIQKFLEAPTAMVKLSGIIVADAVVNSNVDGEKLDFGLDDIIAESKSSDVALGGSQPLMSASADYIAEMRRYLLPIKEQWSDRGTSVDDKDSKHMEAATTKAVDFIREYGSAVPVDDANADMVLAPRQSSLTVPQELGTKYIKPRTPVFLHDCFTYLNSNPPDSEKTKIGLFALTDCISNANTKTVDELWLRVANKLLYLYNRGPDHADWAWDQERRRALTALAVRLPMELGPFMADKSCDRNLTLKDREILFSAISNACLQLSGLGDDTVETPKERIVVVEPPISNAKPKSQEFGSGTVVRRSRKLDLAKQQQQQRQQQRQQLAVAAGSTKTELAKQRRQYASIVGPAFFFPLIAQYGKSDMTTSASDIRHDASMFAQYANTLGIILYTSGTSSHLIRMNREFWDLTKLVRKLKAKSVSESPAVLDALLFGIDVILSPDRALSAPTLANEFRADISDAVVWINSLVERSLLGESAMTHASRVIVRLDELQQDVRRRVMSSDIHQFSSII